MKKCLVLDLDNTLWGGVVGEDGPGGIQLSLTAPGNSFISFQQAILDCYNRGIILAINSRNNPNDALEVIRTNPNMILKEEHFAAMRINWNDKAENLKEIAQELNIGLDSVVFLDDDPTNRAWVRSSLPEVEVPELPPDPVQYTSFFLSLGVFPGGETTDEDSMRGNMYVTERLRREEEKRFTDKKAFLESLNLTLHVYENEESALARLSQLTEKTNQFNASKQPLGPEDIALRMRDGKHLVLHGRLTDRFGDHGIIFLAIVEKAATPWNISSFIMSCRVFDRGVEHAAFAVLLEKAQRADQRTMTIDFTATEKNGPAEAFIKKYFTNNTCSTTSLVDTFPLTIVYESIH